MLNRPISLGELTGFHLVGPYRPPISNLKWQAVSGESLYDITGQGIPKVILQKRPVLRGGVVDWDTRKVVSVPSTTRIFVRVELGQCIRLNFGCVPPSPKKSPRRLEWVSGRSSHPANTLTCRISPKMPMRRVRFGTFFCALRSTLAITKKAKGARIRHPRHQEVQRIPRPEPKSTGYPISHCD